MANLGYYHEQSSSYRHSYSPAPPPPRATPFHLCVFLATAALLGGTSLYSRYESAVETLADQVRVAVVLSPLLFLLAVQYWAAAASRRHASRGGGLSSLLVAPLERPPSWYDGRGYQRDASSPWGVALVLALVLMLVTYQSCFQDLWFPLIRRR